MSGHSKWSTIKRKKAKVDAQRGIAFQKFSREIIMAAKIGGGDPVANFRLRTAIERAKQAGLPNSNIKTAIDRGCGASSAENFEELTYEGYANSGVAVFIEAMTNNRNRTAGDIRSYFTKYQGNLGESGCVAWMFKQVGLITFSTDSDQDSLLQVALESGAEDFIEEDESYKIFTKPEELQNVVDSLEKSGYTPQSAEITRLPENTLQIQDEQAAILILRLMDKLEEHDDIQNVYSNFDIDDALMEKIKDKI